MTQYGGMITDQLYFIIQTIQLGQKTGMLHARRENNSSIEEGSIAFYQGQVLAAHVGQQTGKAAFNTLTGWGACQYTFEAGTSAIKSVLIRLPSQTSFIEPMTDKLTTPLRGQQVPAQDGASPAVNQQLLSSQILLPTVIPHLVMPLNIALTIANELNFSRHHRQVLMLINGQRTVGDIIRLTGRSSQYVSSMLLELERAGALRFQQ
ncbi:MAG TPA: DUF4388 domain-containing protein [Ktedonobacteraceae bacterium]